MSAHPAVHPSVGPFVRWPARLRRRSSSPPLRSDTPASHRCGRMHRPSHRIPSAVSAAPRRIDAPFTPAPRPPHCVSSAASAALPPVRRVRRVCRVRRAPLHRHSVHSRAPSAALCPVCRVRRIASRPPCPPRPVASTLRSFPRSVRRIVSLLLYPPNCLPAAVSAAPRLPPPRRIRHACAELRDPAHPRVCSVSSACPPRLRLFSRRSPMPLPCPRPHAPARRPPRPARNQK